MTSNYFANNRLSDGLFGKGNKSKNQNQNNKLRHNKSTFPNQIFLHKAFTVVSVWIKRSLFIQQQLVPKVLSEKL